MNGVRHALAERQWRQIRDHLPKSGRPGRPWKDHLIDGILWIFKAGAPWRDLPTRFGRWKTVYDRFRRWSRDGTWKKLVERREACRQADGKIDWISVPTGGRRRRRPRRLAGDKAYSTPWLRNWLRARRVEPVIPTRRDQRRERCFDRRAYRRRNVIERCVGWIKECRRIATRVEKLAVHYLGMLRIGMMLRYLG